MPRKPGVRVTRLRSVAAIAPDDLYASEWLWEHTRCEPWNWQGGALIVECRYLSDILAGLRRAGFRVKE